MIYTALQKPAWLSLNASSGLLRGTPLNQHVTTGTVVKIQVNDGKGGLDTLTYTLAIANRVPNITVIFSDTTITEDNAFSYNVASDDEGQGATKYKFVGNVLEWLTLDSLTGQLSGTPLNQHVTEKFGLQLKVDDGNGGTDMESFFVTVLNRAPVFTSTVVDSVAEENKLFTYNANTDDEAQGAAAYSLSGAPPCLLYTSPSPRDGLLSRMPSSA